MKVFVVIICSVFVHVGKFLLHVVHVFLSTCSLCIALVCSARGRYVCLTYMLVVTATLYDVRGGYGRRPGTPRL